MFNRKVPFWVGFLLLVLAGITTPARAYYLDTPHNESNDISCSTCHADPAYGNHVAKNIDDTVANVICLRCHGPEGTAPQHRLHSDLEINGTQNWTTQCVDCHDPHFQDNIRSWAGVDDNGFLVQGTVTSTTYSTTPADDIFADGTTTISYTISTALPGWSDPLNWSGKGGFSAPTNAIDNSRGLIVMFNFAALGDTYEIIKADTTTITLKGQMSPVSGQKFAIAYGQSIRSFMIDANGNGEKYIKLFSPINGTGVDSGFVDNTGSDIPIGLCQVCHPLTVQHWNTDNSGDGPTKHVPNAPCLICHSHDSGFAPGSVDHSKFIVDDNNCAGCHTIFTQVEMGHPTCDSCHTTNLPFVNNFIILAENSGSHDALAGAVDGHSFNADDRLIDSFGRDIHQPQFTTVSCIICHTSKTDWTKHDPQNNTHAANVRATTDQTCETCHANTSIGPFDGPNEVHDNGNLLGCDLCHNSTDGSFKGSAAQNHEIGLPSHCKKCHGVSKHVTPPTAHPAVYEGGQNGITEPASIHNGCANASCHGGAKNFGNTSSSADILAGHTNLATTSFPLGMNCQSCHVYTGDKKPGMTKAKIDAVIRAGSTSASPPVAPSCADCHGVRTEPHGWVDHTLAGTGNYAPITLDNDCLSCHAAYNKPGLAHITSCNACHASAPNLKTNPNLAQFKGTTTTCKNCHAVTVTGVKQHGITASTVGSIHKISSDGSNGFDCRSCHDNMLSGTGQLTRHMVDDTNIANCLICHAATNAPSGASAVTVIATATAPPVTNFSVNCEQCHAAKGDYTLHGLTVTDTIDSHNNTDFEDISSQEPTDQQGLCAGCHPAAFASPNLVAGHVALGSTTTYAAGMDCLSCHNYTGSKLTTNLDAVIAAAVASNTNPNLASCADCHNPRGLTHPETPPNDHLDPASNNYPPIIANPECKSCHSQTISAIHSFTCKTCHATAMPALSDALYDLTQFAGSPTYCTDCHNVTTFPDPAIKEHGITAADLGASHNLSSAACQTCHDTMTNGFNQLTRHMGDGNLWTNCLICHTAVDTTNSTSATGVIATATAPDTNLSVTCEQCHALKGDYTLHGLTVNDTFDSHNNTGFEDISTQEIVQQGMCATCHNGFGNPNLVLSHVNIGATTSYASGMDCLSCHKYIQGAKLPDMTTAKIDAAISAAITSSTNPNLASCADCHSPRTDPHGYIDHTVSGSGNYPPITVDSECITCHATYYKPGEAHIQACDNCHTNSIPQLTISPYNLAQFAGNTTSCKDCHNRVTVQNIREHGITAATVGPRHNLSSTGCQACHDSMVTGAAQLNRHMVDGTNYLNCLICHNAAAAPGASAVTVIATATTPEQNLSVTCEQCHALKGDYTLHGLTVDSVIDVHNNTDFEDVTSQEIVQQGKCSTCHAAYASLVVSHFNFGPTTTFAAGMDCLSCHKYNGYTKTGMTPSMVGAAINSAVSSSTTPNLASCADCHSPQDNPHPPPPPNDHLDPAGNGYPPIIANIECISCHSAGVSLIHLSKSCSTCHATAMPALTNTPYNLTQFANSPTACIECHNTTTFAAIKWHGITVADVGADHNLASAACQTCHVDMLTGAARLTRHMGDGNIWTNCLICHTAKDTINNTSAMGVIANATVPDPNLSVTCEQCHALKGDYTLHGLTITDTTDAHDNTHFEDINSLEPDQKGLCSKCHKGFASPNLAINHVAMPSTTSYTTGMDCLSCHKYTGTTKTGMTTAMIDAAIAAAVTSSTTPNLASCADCHSLRTAPHPETPPNDHLDPAGNGYPPIHATPECIICHIDGITPIHKFNCETCHAATMPLLAATPYGLTQFAGSTTACIDCHNAATFPAVKQHGITAADVGPDHNLSSADCQNCHDTMMTGEAQLTRHMVDGAKAANCLICHAAPTAVGTSATSVIAAATAPETNNSVLCDQCHVAKGAYRLHGMDAVESADVHNNAAFDTTPTLLCTNCHSAMITVSVGHVTLPATSTFPTGMDCIDCHKYSGSKLLTTDIEQAILKAQSATTTPVTASCAACHNGPRPADHPSIVHTSAGKKGYAPITANIECTGCHVGDSVDAVHAGKCVSCHTTSIPELISTPYDMKTKFAGSTTSCIECHHKATFPAITEHGITATEVGTLHNLSSGGIGELNCQACHDTMNTGLAQLNAHMLLTGNCLICHGAVNATSGTSAKTVIANATSPANNLAVTCEQCHAVKGDYTLHGMTIATTTDAHNNTGFEDVNSQEPVQKGLCFTCHNGFASPNLVVNHVAMPSTTTYTTGMNCLSCHTYTQGAKAGMTTAMIDAAIAAAVTSSIYPNLASCADCHSPRANTHPETPTNDHEGVPVGGTYVLIYANPECRLCHSDGITPTHLYKCATCHAAAMPNLITTPYNLQLRVAGSTTSCTDCHKTSTFPAIKEHGITAALVGADHKLSSAACQSCHDTMMSGAVQLTRHMLDGNITANCLICHTAKPAPSGANASSMIAAATAPVAPAANNPVTCEQCHAKKGDYTLHGLTVADTTDAHNNTHNLATTPVSESNNPGLSCLQCHSELAVPNLSAGHIAMTFITSYPNGMDCLSCHNYSGSKPNMANTVIDAAIAAGATDLPANTVECADCHAPLPANHGDHPIPDTFVTKTQECMACHDYPLGSHDYITDIHNRRAVANNLTNCQVCHVNPLGGVGLQNYSATGGVIIPGDKVDYAARTGGNGGACLTCHNDNSGWSTTPFTQTDDFTNLAIGQAAGSVFGNWTEVADINGVTPWMAWNGATASAGTGPSSSTGGYVVLESSTTSASCTVDPAGTYIEAEHYENVIVPGTYNWSIASTVTGANNGQYLVTTTGATATTTQGARTDYTVDIPVAGTYRISMRLQDGGWNGTGGDSTMWGVDGVMVGIITETTSDSWTWTSNEHAPSNQVFLTAGTHTINLWPREQEQLTDAFIIWDVSKAAPIAELDQTTTIPAGITQLNPKNCGSSGDSDPINGNDALTSEASQYLQSNIFDASQYVSLTISFNYSMNVGNNSDAVLSVEGWDGAFWNQTVIQVGSSGPDWFASGLIDFIGYTNPDFAIRIRYDVGTGTLYQNDFAIDQIEISGDRKVVGAGDKYHPAFIHNTITDTAPATCTITCHTEANSITGTHKVINNPADCYKCHQSVDPLVVQAIYNGSDHGVVQNCANCHSLYTNNFENSHTVIGDTHATMLLTDPVCSAAFCHPGDVQTAPAVHDDNCDLCHVNAKANNGTLQGTALNHIVGIPSTCTTCHFDRNSDHTPEHDHALYEDTPTQENTTATNSVSGQCDSCHSFMGYNGTGYTNISTAHVGLVIITKQITIGENNEAAGGVVTCATCHDSANPLVVNTIAAARSSATTPTNASCADCHGIRLLPHGGHDNTHFAADGDCAVCHIGTNITADIHGNQCLLCHSEVYGGLDTAILGSTTNGVDGDATRALALNDYRTAVCSTCHDVPGVTTTNLDAHHLASKNNYYATEQCVACHKNGAIDHDNADFEDILSLETNLDIRGKCSDCHVTFTDLGTGHLGRSVLTNDFGTPIGTEITCKTCHESINPTVVNVIATSKGDTPTNIPASCADCHGSRPIPHGGHDVTHFKASPVCTTICHTIPVTGVTDGIHKNICATCHISTAAGIGPSKIGDAVHGIDGDATLSRALADYRLANCLTCHEATSYPAGAIHHDTRPAATNNCAVDCHKTNNHTTQVTDDTSVTPNCGSCHLNATTNANGTIKLDTVDPQVHDTCRSCHTFDNNMNGILRTPTGSKGVNAMPAGGGSCTKCHNASIGDSHHGNGNSLNGNCDYCHVDPRNDGIGSLNANNGTYEESVTKPLQPACEECHVTPQGATNGWNGGNMTIYSFDEGSTHSTTTYAVNFTRAIAHSGGHVIPNTAGSIYNWGICFECHDGSPAPAMTLPHTMPTWSRRTSADCGTLGAARYAPGRAYTNTMARFYWMGSTYRATSTGNPENDRCDSSTNRNGWAAAGSLKAGLKGMPSVLNSPDPWSNNSANHLIYPNIAKPPTVTTPAADNVKVVSAVFGGADLIVQATNTDGCAALTISYGGVNRSGSCSTTFANANFPLDGLTVDVTTSNPQGVNVLSYPIEGEIGPLPTTANNDSYTVPVDSINYLMEVLGNDFGEGIVLDSVGNAAHGTTTKSGNSVLYNPVTNYTGADTFDYTIRDAANQTATATVNINVTSTGLTFFSNMQNFVGLSKVPTGAFGSGTGTGPSDYVTWTPSYGSPQSNQWAIGTSTPSGSAGPDAGGIDGASDPFLYSEASNTAFGTPAVDAYLTSSALDASAMEITLNFAYNANNVIAGHGLYVEVNDGAGWITHTTVINQATSTRGTQPGTWINTGDIVLSGYTSANMQVRITFNPADNNFSNDMGIDDLTISGASKTYNTPPTAVNDTTTVSQGSSNNIIAVLDNDSDADSDLLTVTAIINQANNGTCSAHPTNVSYTPAPSYFGTDSCSYQISDGNGGTATASISITVTPDSTVSNVTYYVTPSLATSVGVDGSTNYTADRPTSVPTRVLLANAATNTTWSFRPTTGMTQNTWTTLLKSYSQEYNSAATITGVSGGSFAIRGYNPTDQWRFNIYSYNPSGTAGNKSLIASSNVITSGTGATVTVNPTWTGTGSIPAGQRLLMEIDYRPGGTTLTPRIYNIATTFSVAQTQASNNTPPTANNDLATVAQNSSNNTINVLANDTDVDGDTLTVEAITSLAAHGTCTANTTTVRYTPTAGYSGSDSCTYRISDGNGGTATATISITVTPSGGGTVSVLSGWDAPTAGLSHPYTAPAGNNRALVVGVTTEGATITGVASTCATMNLVGSAVGGTSTTSTTTIYYGLLGNSTATTSCNITATGGAQQNISAATYGNVRQTAGINTNGTVAIYDAQTDSDASASENVSVTVNNPAGGYPVYVFNKNGGSNAVVPSSGWTQLRSVNGAGNNMTSWGQGSSTVAQPALVFTDTGTTENRGSMVGFTLNP